MGYTTKRVLGSRRGAIVTGFLGGLISSTATTASLAKRSQQLPNSNPTSEVLTFLAATLAMLFEAISILVLGTTDRHWSLIGLVMAPAVVSIVLIFSLSRRHMPQHRIPENEGIQIFPILKLTLFIVATVALSNLSKNVFGQNSLLVVTFIVSLFEIHGSIIANIQLHDLNVIDVPMLALLLTISILASYLSKLFIISSIGSLNLRKQAFRYTAYLLASLGLSFAFYSFASSLAQT
jgi:uncharacterized membrane protein (DUF4010 family)